MKRNQIRYALLAVLVVFLAPTAIAQSPAPRKDDNAYATPASRSMAEPLKRDSGAMEVQSQTIAPVNVPANILDGEPRDFHGEKARTSCSNDPLTGEIPVTCRRWSEIASQSFSGRLRSES